MFPGPLIEFHISSVHKREQIYHNSLISPVVTAVMAGTGVKGYGHADRILRYMIAEADAAG